jgi:hypothetical protein
MYVVGIEDREYKEDKVECKIEFYSIKFPTYSFQGWSTVYGYNMACLKNYVMREPLVDTVDKRQICTDHFPMKVKSYFYGKLINLLFL